MGLGERNIGGCLAALLIVVTNFDPINFLKMKMTLAHENRCCCLLDRKREKLDIFLTSYYLNFEGNNRGLQL